MNSHVAPDLSAGGLADIFFGRAVSRRLPKRRPQNEFRIIRDFRRDRDSQPIVAWELVYRMDWSGGRGTFQGPWEEVNNCFAEANGWDTLNPGYLFPSWAQTSSTAVQPTGNRTFYSTFIFDTLIMAAGSGTNVSLFKETSATDPTPVAITYNPDGTSHITCLGNCTLNSVRYLIVGLSAQVADVLSDASGSDAGTNMEAATQPLWGILETSLPHASGGFTVLVYASTSILTGNTTGAINQTLTSQKTGLRGGGYFISPGEFSLGDSPSAAWIWMPNDANTTGGLQLSAEVLGQVYRVQLDASDITKLEFNSMKRGVKLAIHHEGTIVAHDGTNLVQHTGSEEIDLGILNEIYDLDNSDDVDTAGWQVDAPRRFPSSRTVRLRNMGSYKGVLWVEVEFVSSTNYYRTTRYSLIDGRWQPSQYSAIVNDNPGRICLGPVTPISENTGTAYTYDPSASSGTFYLHYLPSPAANEYWNEFQTSTTRNVAVAAYLWTPRTTLPGLAGYPSIVSSIGATGIITTSANSNGFRVDVIPQTAIGTYTAATASTPSWLASATFTGTSFATWRNAYYKKFPANTEQWYEFLMRLAWTRAATSDRMYVSEVRIRGLTFLDGKVRSPLDVWGSEAAIP